MRKILTLASMSVLVLMFALTAFATDPGPNWSDINDIVPAAGLPRPGNVGITEDLISGGYPTPSDAGPYAIGYVGHSSDTYCNTDRHIVFYNWVSVAQWMRVKATDIDRHIMIRKPGTYEFTTRPMMVRLASNGDVLVTFQELSGDGNWNAKWYEYSFYPGKNPPTIWDKTYPQLANELDRQIPVDKKYETIIVPNDDAVFDPPTTGFQDAPAAGAILPGNLTSGAPSTDGAGTLVFKNSEALHNLKDPGVGFDMQFQEIVAPCNTTGDYVLKARMVFQCANQMWYINPLTGAIDGTRNSTAIPPAPYPAP